MAKRQEKLEQKQPKLTLSNRLKIQFEDLKEVVPLTINQKIFFDAYDKNERLIMLHGVAGTGKTYIALYKALKEALQKPSLKKRIIIVRSAVQAREIGYLPGDAVEKNEVYQIPYKEICADLLHKYDAFQRLQEQHMINFVTTSFLRGLTLDNSIIIVDECQNLNDAEINTIMTRVGNNSKIIFCGDFRQTDLNKRHDVSGLKKFIEIVKMIKGFRMVEFDTHDIVRSDLVKQYILARLEYEEKHV
jgi:phosphate starvation-inducible protein PhoH